MASGDNSTLFNDSLPYTVPEEYKNGVYLDYNATTPLHPEVIDTMASAMRKLWRNPSSTYSERVRDAISKARAQTSDVIGAKPEEIIFTSSGTEANNWILEAIVSWASELRGLAEGKPCIVTSDIEHDAVSKKVLALQAKGLCDVKMVSGAQGGRVNVRDVVDNCSENTCLISIMLANNETGVIQPVAEIGQELIRINIERTEKGLKPILFHTDAAQAVGKIACDVTKLNVDFLTIVGHKFYGPRIGAVYCRSEYMSILKKHPFLWGGGQERGYRPSTENTVDIVGLGQACEVVQRNLSDWASHFYKTGSYLKDSLIETFGKNLDFNFPVLSEFLLPNTFSVHFVGKEREGFKVLNQAEYLQASTGAACHSGKTTVSIVLLHSGLSKEAAKNTIRLSIGRTTTKEEIDITIKDLYQAVQKLTGIFL
ncbi:selenocysteine lyase-like [Paramacrobiotus metropolitanus]|uniref:selenocysteine lyase-like n=1 Tax=Paramacrobiotus metropolitanus TaxID=2943436 RepID=UPI002445B712|nr:selenocysteine lyase-like [Paramacrobiotus metropolitanus]XP_055333969.1 selenocysteine lyase-like [Paramacrobiotus metropolitanus]